MPHFLTLRAISYAKLTISMENLKSSLRALFRRIRKDLSVSRRVEAMEFLHQAFSSYEGFICSYSSFKDELETSLLNRSLMKDGRLVLPKISGTNLELYQVGSPQQLQYNSLGILEPIPAKCLVISQSLLSFVLVPGIAFDKHHHRIGYGRGFYDRFLSKIPAYITTYGICFRETLSEKAFPIAKSDYPVKNLAAF
ncbi:putative 5-formyltetrahydrofolate cyclo-ligase [Chlamydiales bacterium STE3]|nr:putative 5-formyltetrahydrofolate cyclo-ligase [Chlamydiales bacterium STE3]